MNIKLSGYMTLFLFIVLAVIGFTVWVGGLFVIWLIMKIAGITIDLWAMIEALSTAVAAATVLSAGFVAYRELTEIVSNRHIDVAYSLFEELNSLENIDARRWVFQNLHGSPKEEIGMLSDEGRAAIKQVLNSLDHVAFMTQSGWIPDEIIMPWMHPMIAKSWEKLKPYIIYERQRRNEPYYYQNIDKLTERCLTWRSKNLPDVTVTWVDDAL